MMRAFSTIRNQYERDLAFAEGRWREWESVCDLLRRKMEATDTLMEKHCFDDPELEEAEAFEPGQITLVKT